MKLIDFDGLFDEKLTQYMTENKNKHTEKQWEDIIPKLYKKFGDTRIAKIGCTPKEYYARMTDEELVSTLCAHLEGEVPVPEFLCTEIETRGAAQACPRHSSFLRFCDNRRYYGSISDFKRLQMRIFGTERTSLPGMRTYPRLAQSVFGKPY